MKILILSNEVWNDRINGNNVTSNWFQGFEAEFANIYCSPGLPDNMCCNQYYQITDKMMIRSILCGKKAGICLDEKIDHNGSGVEEESEGLYRFLKRISGDFMRLVRELIWLTGRYDLRSMKCFIDEFSPDIIFSERMASCKMLRLERIVSNMSAVPFIAFTGDDEYSLRQFKLSPFFWLNRFMIRRKLRKMVKKYSIYYTLSYEQLEDYKKRFGCNMKILQKCGEVEQKEEKNIHDPIKIIYAGKLYMKRWMALEDIAECIKKINKNGKKMILEIYTKDTVSERQKRVLDDKVNCFICSGVPQEELRELYRNSDIALHVESKKLSQRLATRLSFSTKIIDCLFSGCAVLAYCWSGQSGWKYLQREDAAICVDNKEDLYEKLKMISDDKEQIQIYSLKARACCERNHLRAKVQKGLKDDFYGLIHENTVV